MDGRASVDALAFVARRIADERVVLLCTARGLSGLLGDERTTAWIQLEGVSEGAAYALVRSRAPGLAAEACDRIVSQAGGNPLALIEFAAAVRSGASAWSQLDSDLPMTLRLERAFTARADELDAASRALLDLAALDDGDEVGPLLAAASVFHQTPIGREALVQATSIGLMTETHDRYRFNHPLVASALRQALSPVERRRGHQALAEHPERALWHRAAAVAGRDEAVAAQLTEAAATAHRRGAVATALTWLELAAVLSADPAAEAARLLSAAELGYELGRFAQVEEIKARVAQMTLRPRDRSRLAWLDGVFHDGSNSHPGEVRQLVVLARRATDEGDTDLAMQLLFGAARRVWWRDPGEATRVDIVRAAEEVGVPERDPRFLAVLGLADSARMGPRVADGLAGWPADADGRPDVAGVLGVAAFCSGDFARAEAFLSTAITAVRAQGRLSLLAEALAIRSWAEVYLGRFDPSRSADEALRLADETGQSAWAGTARIAVAMTDAIRGSRLDRHPLLAQAQRIALDAPIGSSSLLAAVQLALGLADLATDRPAQAYGNLRRVFVPTDAAHHRMQQIWTMGFLADAAVRSGRRAEAATVLESMESLAGSTPPSGSAIELDYARAVLADGDAADELFHQALAGAARPFPWHQARLQLAYGSWLRRHRRVTESRDPLRAARTTFDGLGAKPWAQRADQELRATGERGWEPTSSVRELLSPQESQIAGLAARGYSNREIGQRLFLSHRTVGSHLYRIFPKLGVTSRQQLAAILNEAQSSD